MFVLVKECRHLIVLLQRRLENNENNCKFACRFKTIETDKGNDDKMMIMTIPRKFESS